MEILVELIVQAIVYFLCVVVVRVVTFGWVRVDMDDRYFHNGWVMWMYDGTILLRHGVGIVVGLLILIAIGFGVVLGLHDLGWM